MHSAQRSLLTRSPCPSLIFPRHLSLHLRSSFVLGKRFFSRFFSLILIRFHAAKVFISVSVLFHLHVLPETRPHTLSLPERCRWPSQPFQWRSLDLPVTHTDEVDVLSLPPSLLRSPALPTLNGSLFSSLPPSPASLPFSASSACLPACFAFLELKLRLSCP